jgi:3-methylcrotonyl-CoA carboxylase alpha subunit
VDELAQSADISAPAGSLTSPMPGRVVHVNVENGQKVAKGDALMTIEAMKMEHTVTAPANGTVSAVHFRAGDMIDEGVELLVLET